MLILFLFLGGCYAIYRNDVFTSGVSEQSLSRQIVQAALHRSLFHDSNYFSGLAERLQFYPHNPKDIMRLYTVALLKSPADYKVPFAFAKYLSARGGYEKKSLECYNESLRRFPTSAEIHLAVGQYLIQLRETDKGLLHLRTALELSSYLAPKAYAVVEEYRLDKKAIMKITPQNQEGLIILAKLLTSRRSIPHEDLVGLLQRLSRMSLTPEQRGTVAQCALTIGELQLAADQARLAYESDKKQIKAMEILASVAMSNQDVSEYKRVIAQIEHAYLREGDWQNAAQTATQAALFSGDNGKELNEVIKRYPDFAPAYFHLAISVEQEAPELTIQYLNKALELSPEKTEYRKRLVETYLRLSRFLEAEKTCEPLLTSRGKPAKAGYLLMARIHSSVGNHLEAATVLDEAIQQIGTSKEFALQLGKEWELSGEYQKAAKAYLEYARLTNGKAEAHNLAGDAYKKAGNSVAARIEYKKALSKHPTNSHAREALKILDSEP